LKQYLAMPAQATFDGLERTALKVFPLPSCPEADCANELRRDRWLTIWLTIWLASRHCRV
jgi:hypothetical protein